MSEACVDQEFIGDLNLMASKYGMIIADSKFSYDDDLNIVKHCIINFVNKGFDDL